MYHELNPPTTADTFCARNRVSQHLSKTPLVRSEALSAEFDADVYLKREDTLPTGAFKVRDDINLIPTRRSGCLSPLDERTNLRNNTIRCFRRATMTNSIKLQELTIRENIVNRTDTVFEVRRSLSPSQ